MTRQRTAAVDDEQPSIFKLKEAFQAGDLWGFVDALVDSGGDVHPADPLRRLRTMVRDRAQHRAEELEQYLREVRSGRPPAAV